MAYVKSTNTKSEENKVNFNRTSSLNKYFLCHYCERKFNKREIIQQHVITCLSNRTCKWCKLVFKNRGNLVTHAYYIHNDKSKIKMISNEVPSKEDENRTESDIVNDMTQSDPDVNSMGPPLTNIIKKSVKPKKEPANTCDVCGKSFGNNGGLKYHIRRAHFNLVAKIPSYEEKQINQVWFEKVLNSDSIVEIKKAGHNMLLLRKLDNNTPVRVQECKVLLDLTSLYPTGNRVTLTKCDICQIDLLERDYKKHYDEKHGEVKKHHCNNCNMTFKRSYFFIRHKCNRTAKGRRRKMQCQISKVESLTPIPV